MSVNVGMKFTMDTNKSVTKTLTEIRSTPITSTSGTFTKSRFTMANLGRTPQLSLNNFNRSKPKGGGCGCCGS
jgi:hypothetical protein